MGIHKKHVLERLSKEEEAHHRYLNEFFLHLLECVVTKICLYSANEMRNGTILEIERMLTHANVS